jgi:anti-sigma-K factor RskA
MAMSTCSDDDVALAAELVLGLLDPAADAAARAKRAQDPAFAEEVAAWENRLIPLALGTETPAPDTVWTAIEARLTTPVRQDNAVSKLRLWQGISATATVAAVVLGFMVLNTPVTPVPVPQAAVTMVAALRSDAGPSSVTASFDSGSGALTITPVRLVTGKLFPEVWLIPADGVARSLGIVGGTQPSRVAIAPALQRLMQDGATLAITPEPQTGAPGGKATGPIIASGRLQTL